MKFNFIYGKMDYVSVNELTGEHVCTIVNDHAALSRLAKGLSYHFDAEINPREIIVGDVNKQNEIDCIIKLPDDDNQFRVVLTPTYLY